MEAQSQAAVQIFTPDTYMGNVLTHQHVPMIGAKKHPPPSVYVKVEDLHVNVPFDNEQPDLSSRYKVTETFTKLHDLPVSDAIIAKLK
jgi:hypothetical protein